MIDYHKQFAPFFDQLADAAGDIARHYFRREIPVDDKADKSPVTQADREIEQKLRQMIAAQFPAHGIIGEEFGAQNENAEFVWVLDPIDGTASFITGRPLFGTIIGLMHNGKPVAGLVDQAITHERWFGIDRSMATYNGRVVKVAPSRKLQQARLYTGSISMFEGEHLEGFLRLCRGAKLTRYASDCYAYGLLAMGWIDVCVEMRLGLYDVAGIAPVITGTGGFISDWGGNPIGMDFNGFAVGASSKELAMEAVALFGAEFNKK